MSAPVQPQTPDVKAPIPPGAPVPVIPKTAAQQKRSAWYTAAIALFAGVAAIAEALQQYAPQIESVLPRRYVHAFALLMMAINFGMLASQRFHAAKTESIVDKSAG